MKINKYTFKFNYLTYYNIAFLYINIYNLYAINIII